MKKFHLIFIFLFAVASVSIFAKVIVKNPTDSEFNGESAAVVSVRMKSAGRKVVKNPKKNNSISRPFYDDFDRLNGLIADNYGNEDSMGKWEVTSQKFQAKDSRGFTDSPIFRMVTKKSDFKDFILSSKMMKTDLGIDSWDGLQLFFRYKDYDNLYAAGLRNDNHLQLKKKVNGAYSTLAMVSMNSNKLNHWYDVKVIAKQNHISVYVDGKKYIDAFDDSISSGKVGIRTDNVNAYFDNYSVNV